MMNVTISAAIAYIAAGKTLFLNAFVRCTTAASFFAASLISLPVPMKKNIVIDWEKRPTMTVPRAQKMCVAMWPGAAVKPRTAVAMMPAMERSVVIRRNWAKGGDYKGTFSRGGAEARREIDSQRG